MPRRAMLAFIPLCIYLVLYFEGAIAVGWKAGIGRNVATDLTAYISAARVVRAGSDPYNGNAVWRVERGYIHLAKNPPAVNMRRVAEPPVLFWAIQPLTYLPFRAAGLVGEMLILLCAALGLATLLRLNRVKRPALALVVGLLMSPVLLYVYSGNAGVVVFAALAIGLAAARRYPLIAGAILSIAVCKPQVALPLAGLIILFHGSSRHRAIAGFVLGAAGILGASALVTGPQSLLWWMQGFESFGGTLRYQPQIASLPGLYIQRLPAHVSLLLTAGLILLASTLTAITAWRLRHTSPVSVRSLAWLWILWFLVAPYDHYYDYLFLAPVLLSCFACPERRERIRAILLLYGVVLLGLPPGLLPAQLLVSHLVPVAVLVSLLPLWSNADKWQEPVSGPAASAPAGAASA